MSEAFAITDAVVALLNATEFSLPFEAERIERQIDDLTALDTLKVCFMPATRKVSIVTREGKLKAVGDPKSGRQRKYVIDGSIQMKFQPGGAAPDIDPLADLVEEIADFLLGRTLAGPPAKCIDVDHPFLFFPDHWEKRLFTSTISLTYLLGP